MGVRMSANETNYRTLDVNERILRRFSDERFPIMVKGSYLTSSVFPDPFFRRTLSDGPDFAVLARVPVKRSAKNVDFAKLVDLFDLSRILETAFDVLVEEYPELATRASAPVPERFDKKETFVELDFITVRFEIRAGDDSYRFDFSLDQYYVEEPTAFEYRPRVGEPFVIPYAERISTQVSGKLHQTLLRVRTKDPIDLWRIMPTVDWNDSEILENCLRSIVADCGFFPDPNLFLDDLQLILDGDGAVVERLYSRSKRRVFVKNLPKYAGLVLEPDETFDPTDEAALEKLEARVWERFISAASGSMGAVDWRSVLDKILATR